jgi:hypothetical protein
MEGIMSYKMLPWLRLGMLSMVALLNHYSQAGTGPFRDGQGRFTVSVLEGWTATTLDENTIQLAAPLSYVTIVVFAKSYRPDNPSVQRQMGSPFVNPKGLLRKCNGSWRGGADLFTWR